MNEAVKEAEILPEQALVKTDPLQAMVKPQDQPVFDLAARLESLDWKAMRPPEMALLLCQKPFTVSGGGTMYLNFRQALWYAVRCHELGVSPFGTDTWFDPAKFSVSLTLEGKRQVARNKGIDLGPPKFEELSRPWSDVPKVTDLVKDLQKQGFSRDVGVKCSIRVGDVKNAEYAEYSCWLSDWMVLKSPVWQSKYHHMLQTRACEKCISMALGTGASESLSDET